MFWYIFLGSISNNVRSLLFVLTQLVDVVFQKSRVHLCWLSLILLKLLVYRVASRGTTSCQEKRCGRHQQQRRQPAAEECSEQQQNNHVVVVSDVTEVVVHL